MVSLRQTGERLNFNAPRLYAGRERFAALALILAFASAGWKIANHPPASNFVAVSPRAAVLPGAGSKAVKVLPAPSPPQQLSPDGRFRFEAQFVSSAPGRAVHAPSVVELSGGGLRAVWFSGSREGAGDVVIKTSVMDQASLRWSEESTLFDRLGIERGLWRYVKKLGNPVIARASDGSLFLWIVTVSVGGWAGSSISWSRSTDDGGSWSIPRRLVTSPFLNISTLVKGAPFFYTNGQIGVPVYHELASKFAEVLRIDAGGQILDKTRIPGSHRSLQPVVLPVAAGQASAYMRSGAGAAVMMSATSDAGKTWSAAHATAWPNPDSALAGVVTDTGEQWLALNPVAASREVLGLLHAPAQGTFDGASLWLVESPAAPQTRLSVIQYEALLAAELKSRGASEAQAQSDVASARRQLCGASTCSREFSYPYLLQSRDGYLHLLYTWHRARIKHVRLDPLQIAQPDAASPAATHAAPSATH